MKPQLNIVPRIEDFTGCLLLCYRNGRGGQVDYNPECYNVTDGYHFNTYLGYYYQHTKPAPIDAASVGNAFKEYIKDWEGDSIPVLRKRLNRIKGV